MAASMGYNVESGYKGAFFVSPFHFSTRVFYGDIDKDLNLSLTGAMRLMQEAAVVHSALSGYSVMDVERTRVVWMLVQWRVRLTGKVCWNTPVEVITWPQTMEKLTSNRCFRILDGEGREIAIGESTWLLANADTGRVMRIPSEVADAYDLIPDGVFDTPPEKLPAEVGKETFSCIVSRRDLDTNHHVNNLVYLDYAREALPEDAAEYSEVMVRYHRQLLLGDPVHCHYTPLPNGHAVQICGVDPKHIHCTVLFLK